DEVLAVMPARRGEHHGVERAALPLIEPVELEARRAAAREAVVAEQVVRLHAVEDPGVVVVARRRRAAIGVAPEGALAGEADAAQRLWWPVAAPPQAAVGAVERVIVLAGLGGPGTDAALGAPDLDRARHLVGERDAPVEAVAAEIH